MVSSDLLVHIALSLQESMRALLEMRRKAKEKELEAILSGDNDSCSCFIEVISLIFRRIFQ